MVGTNDGIYVTHLRNQVDGLVESVKEALEIGEKGKLPVLVSHHKSIGKRNWGKVKDTLKLLASNLSVSFTLPQLRLPIDL